MKLLLFTDSHGSKKAHESIKKKVKKHNPDLLVCAGDVTIFENDIDSIIGTLAKLKKELVIIHGNHESHETMKEACKAHPHIKVLHKSGHKKEHVLFLGYGGGGFAQVDKEFENFSKSFEKEIKTHAKENSNHKTVLILHGPPYKTRLDEMWGDFVGNKSTRKFIEKNNIDLVVCGHLHENAGKSDFIKKTKVINPGPHGEILEV